MAPNYKDFLIYFQIEHFPAIKWLKKITYRVAHIQQE